jgi:sugar phosphate isomerase/epimerase
MKEPKTGVQLYTLRDYIQTAPDFDRTLSRLQQMGVSDIQISGIGGDIPTDEIALIVQKYDMHVCVTHQSYDRLCNDLPGVIDLHQKIGCDAVGLGCGPSESRAGLEPAKAFVKNLEAIAKNLAAHGLRFHYHNHDFEFRACDSLELQRWGFHPAFCCKIRSIG